MKNYADLRVSASITDDNSWHHAQPHVKTVNDKHFC